MNLKWSLKSGMPKANVSDQVNFSGLWHCLRMVACTSVLVCLGALSGCDDHPTNDLNTVSEMVEALSKKGVKGMSLNAAKTFMVAEGFEVEELKKAKWKKKSDLDYLRCKREDGSPPIKRRWEVALINDGKVVNEIEARSALVYP